MRLSRTADLQRRRSPRHPCPPLSPNAVHGMPGSALQTRPPDTQPRARHPGLAGLGVKGARRSWTRAPAWTTSANHLLTRTTTAVDSHAIWTPRASTRLRRSAPQHDRPRSLNQGGRNHSATCYEHATASSESRLPTFASGPRISTSMPRGAPLAEFPSWTLTPAPPWCTRSTRCNPLRPSLRVCRRTYPPSPKTGSARTTLTRNACVTSTSPGTLRVTN